MNSQLTTINNNWIPYQVVFILIFSTDNISSSLRISTLTLPNYLETVRVTKLIHGKNKNDGWI